MPSTKRIITRNRNPEISSPSQALASIDDLLSEIFVRLPVKSLLKFKSVSKQWLSLISDPQFISRKSLKSNPVSLLALNKGHRRRLHYDVVPLQGKAPLTTLTFAGPHGDMTIISSCKGLLLCSSSLYLQETKYFMYNPTTRQFRTLPSPCGRADDMQIVGLCLAFDPPKSQSYRVACTRQGTFCYDRFQVVVYSSETGRWRVSGAPFSVPNINGSEVRHAVYCHGAIHWIPSGNGASLCFDLYEELAREIPLPPPSDSTAQARQTVYFGESGGHLHLMQVVNFFTTQFPIYEMERDCSCWFVKFSVDLSSAISSQYRFQSQLLHLSRGEKEEDSFLVMHVYDKVFRYNFSNKTRQAIYSTLSGRKLLQCNLSNQTHELIGRTTSRIHLYSCCGIYQYIESLYPV